MKYPRLIDYRLAAASQTSAARDIHVHDQVRPQAAPQLAILLVSEDPELSRRLRNLAGLIGFDLLQPRSLTETTRALVRHSCAAVLLDLDSTGLPVWDVAERVLLDETAPPLILLTARKHDRELNAAVQAGVVAEKPAKTAQVAEMVGRILLEPGSAEPEKRARQKVLIRWLKPCSWSVPVGPAYRWWGINE